MFIDIYIRHGDNEIYLARYNMTNDFQDSNMIKSGMNGIILLEILDYLIWKYENYPNVQNLKEFRDFISKFTDWRRIIIKL